MKMTVKCLTLDYDSVFLQSLELRICFQEKKKWGHLLRAGLGTEEPFPGDSHARNSYNVVSRWGGEMFFSVIQIFTLRSKALMPHAILTSKEEDVFFFFFLAQILRFSAEIL